MGNVTSTLTMKLIDQVSPGAKKVQHSLDELNRKASRMAGTTAGGFDKVAKAAGKTEVAVNRVARSFAPLTTSSASHAAGLERIATSARLAETALARAGRAARPLTPSTRSPALGHAPKAGGGTPPPAGAHDAPTGHDPHAKTAATWAALETAKGIARRAVESGAELTRQRVHTDAAGLSPAEQKEVEDASLDLSRKYPSVGQSAVMQMLRNARAATGDLHHAFAVMDPLVRLRVLAQAKHPDKDVSGEFDNLVRGMEIKGVAQSTEKFTHYMDGMAKAINIFGDTVTPSAYYQMFKYGRGATAGYSDEYMLKVAPTLASELGGSSAGTAGSAFHQAIIGRKLSQGALKELASLGLLDDGKVSRGKGGRIVTAPGAVVGTDLARSDPYEWVNQVLLPAFKAKGIEDPGAIGDHISAIFGNRMAQQIVSIFATQQGRIEKDRTNISGAKGLSAADEYLKRDPTQALAAVKAQMENLLANASSPLMPAATAMLGGLADALGRLAGAAKNHPLASSEALVAGTAAAGWGAAEMARAAMHWMGWGGQAGATAGGGFLSRLATVGRAAGPIGLATLAFNTLIEGFLAADDTGRTHPYGTPGDAWKQRYEENRRANTDLIEDRNRAEARRAWRDGTLMEQYPDRGFHRAAPSPVAAPTIDGSRIVGEAEAIARQIQDAFARYAPVIRPQIVMPNLPGPSYGQGGRVQSLRDGSYSDDGGKY